MTISKQLSPVGYLNKMTGHIWTPTEQPNAADEPGLYEPLVLSREALAEVQQKDALQLSVDNILRGLGITGDGPFSQLVLDKFIAIQTERDALAAENANLIEAIKTHQSSTHFCEVCGKDDPCSTDDVCYVLNGTPATDVAIAEIKAQGLDEFAEFCRKKADIRAYNFFTDAAINAKKFAANLRAGR